MLRAAADTSGNVAYLSIVFGEENAIRACRSRTGHERIHMREIADRRERERIVRTLRTGNSVSAFCFRIERPTIVKRIQERLTRARRWPKPKGYVQDHFDNELRRLIAHSMTASLNAHSVTMEQLIFEIDTDLIRMFSYIGWQHVSPGEAFGLADAIAWGNNARIQLDDSIREIDISSTLESAIRKRVKV